MGAENGVVLIPNDIKTMPAQMLKFAEHYATSHNALQAAVLAGYKRESALAHSHALIDNPRIAEAVEYYRAVNESTSLYTPEKIKAQWAEMASFNVLDCCDADYALKPLDQLTPEQKHKLGIALVGLKIVERNGKRFVEPKFARETALQELGKINRMYADDKTQAQGLTLTVNLAQQINTSDEAQEEENIGHLRIVSEPGT